MPRLLNAAVILTIVTSTAWTADTAIHPAGIKVSSNQASRPEGIIDGAGLSNVGGKWVHSNEKYAEGGTMWNSGYDAAGAAGQANAVLDLSAAHQVTGLTIWNYNEKDYQGRGAKEIEVSTSADGTTFAKGGNFTLKQAAGQNGEEGQTFKLTAPVAARYVKILVLGIYSGNEPVVGLSEVAVLVTEPAASDKVLK